MKAESLFLEAISIEDEDCRIEFVKNLSASQEVKEEALQLLRAHHNQDEFLEGPLGTGETVSMAPITEAAGMMIGNYKLLQQIGEGGFGVVFMAERTGEIRQKVAIKIVKPGMDSKEVIQPGDANAICNRIMRAVPDQVGAEERDDMTLAVLQRVE